MTVSRLLILVAILATASAGVCSAECTAPDCYKIIDNGSDANKLVLVVMGDGYSAADQDKYNEDVDRLLVQGVFGHDLFREDQNAFNVYRLNLMSVESGVSQRRYDEHGTPGDGSDDTIISETLKNTALKIIYSGSWAHCWLEGSAETGQLVDAVLNTYVPNRKYVVILLNEDGFGGCGGGGFQTVPRGVGWDVLAHEYGHGIGGLADEYGEGGSAWTGGDYNGPNCSTFLDRQSIYWRRFIGPQMALPTVRGPEIDPNRTVGAFEGCGTCGTGIYRPVDNCRMNGNSPPYCPVCYTLMKSAFYPFVSHNFEKALAGDFDGDRRSDLLVHNGSDLAIYRAESGRPRLEPAWVANNLVPAGSGGATWQPADHDEYLLGDFDADGRQDVYAVNTTDWATPYLGMLRSTGQGLECVARYDGTFSGIWRMRARDRWLVGDFDGDGKADLAVFNGSDMQMPYLAVFRSTGNRLVGSARYDGQCGNWQLRQRDRFYVADFDADGRQDLFASDLYSTTRRFGLLRGEGPGFSVVRVYGGNLPGWVFQPGDRYYVADFDGDNRSDLFIRRTTTSENKLAMVRSTGSGLSGVRMYAGGLPGWTLRRQDQIFVWDADHDGRQDLLVYNAYSGQTEELGFLRSSGTALSARSIRDWVCGWNLGQADRFLPCNYEGAPGNGNIFIRNREWFGQLRWTDLNFAMDAIYFHWIYNPLYDTHPWSDQFP